MDRLLCSVYSLNSSQTKKVVIGLEYDDEQQQYVPKLRLTGRDANNVAFTAQEWSDLKNVFGDINLFYNSYNRRNFGDRITTSKHDVKLCTYKDDRAIEISETVDEVDGPPKKKWVPSVIFKFGTFDNLRKIISAIDTKIYVLNNVAASMDKVVNEFCKYLHDLLQKPHEAQHFFVTARMIETANIVLKEEEADKMKNSLSVEHKIDISRNEIFTLFYDFLCLKPDYLAYKYNMFFDHFEKSGQVGFFS